MKNILTIFRKEFYRVISDRRLVFTAILLPGLAIYVMYSFIGSAIGGELEDITQHKMIIYTENMPTDFQNFLYAQTVNPEFHDYALADHDEVEQQILTGEVDMIIIFSSTFEQDIENQIVSDIMIYYNPGEKYSESSYHQITNIISLYSDNIGIERHGDTYYAFTLESEIIMDSEKASGQQFAMLLPMLIIMFLFSGAMSIGPDSIAGEKERGTIATLLITPVKRSEIAIGKVLSLTTISMLSATSSFIGIMFSLPKLMSSDGQLDIFIYDAWDIIMLFSVLLATVLVIAGLVAVLSAYAKSIKEASMLILPFYFVSMALGISTMFSGEASTNLWVYFLPIYSSVNLIIAILTFDISVTAFFITVSTSLIYVAIFVYILTRLFQSEKIMFQKWEVQYGINYNWKNR